MNSIVSISIWLHVKSSKGIIYNFVLRVPPLYKSRSGMGCSETVLFYLTISVATVHTKQIHLDLYLKEFAVESICFYPWFSEKKTFFYPVNIRSLSFGLKTVFGDL